MKRGWFNRGFWTLSAGVLTCGRGPPLLLFFFFFFSAFVVEEFFRFFPWHRVGGIMIMKNLSMGSAYVMAIVYVILINVLVDFFFPTAVPSPSTAVTATTTTPTSTAASTHAAIEGECTWDLRDLSLNVRWR